LLGFLFKKLDFGAQPFNFGLGAHSGLGFLVRSQEELSVKRVEKSQRVFNDDQIETEFIAVQTIILQLHFHVLSIFEPEADQGRIFDVIGGGIEDEIFTNAELFVGVKLFGDILFECTL